MLIRRDSRLHKALASVARHGRAGTSQGNARALAQLAGLGLVTAGDDIALTAAGRRALRRIEQAGQFSTSLTSRSG